MGKESALCGCAYFWRVRLGPSRNKGFRLVAAIAEQDAGQVFCLVKKINNTEYEMEGGGVGAREIGKNLPRECSTHSPLFFNLH